MYKYTQKEFFDFILEVLLILLLVVVENVLHVDD